MLEYNTIFSTITFNWSEVLALILLVADVIRRINEKKLRQENANRYNVAFEDAQRLSESLGGKHERLQAESLVSFLRAETLNLVGRDHDVVGGAPRFLQKFLNRYL